MPIDYSRYPADWHTVIRPEVLRRARHRCEGTPQYPQCQAEDGEEWRRQALAKMEAAPQ